MMSHSNTVVTFNSILSFCSNNAQLLLHVSQWRVLKSPIVWISIYIYFCDNIYRKSFLSWNQSIQTIHVSHFDIWNWHYRYRFSGVFFLVINIDFRDFSSIWGLSFTDAISRIFLIFFCIQATCVSGERLQFSRHTRFQKNESD